MSGFLSREAQAALQDDDEAALRLFYQSHGQPHPFAGSASGSAYPPSLWTPDTYSSMSYSQSSAAQSYTAPLQYVSWPSSSLPSLQPADYAGSNYPSSLSPGYAPSTTPIVPSSPYLSEPWPNAPWPALHPDDVDNGSSASRSVSPNPSDLHHFGHLLPDGKSWRCAHEGCTSQARFTRGCDLRKHFRRHTKSLFCRHDSCPQSREGGFSSKKDRDRHESRHQPGVLCSHPECGKLFSRVDNMKDHVRRIHGKKR